MLINNLKINKSNLLIPIIVITFCVIIAGIFYPQINILVFGIIIATLLIGSIDQFYSLLMFLLPFTMIIKLDPSSSSTITYAVILSSLYILLFRIKKINRRVAIYSVLCIGFFILRAYTNIILAIKLISGICMFVYFVETVKPESFARINLSFIWGLILSSFLGLYKTEIPQLARYFSDFNMEYIAGETVSRFSGLYLDPNYFSISIILGIAMCIALFEARMLIIAKLIIYFVLLIYFGTISYSRSFFLVLGIMVILYTLYKVTDIRKVFFSLVCIGIILYALYYVADYTGLLEGVLYRFERGDASGGGGRFETWLMYIKYFIESPLSFFIGDGLAAKTIIGGAHNAILSSIHQFGIIGLLLYSIVLFNILNSTSFVRKRNLMNYITLIIFVAISMTLDTTFLNDTIYYFMIIWMNLNINFKNRYTLKPSNKTS